MLAPYKHNTELVKLCQTDREKKIKYTNDFKQKCFYKKRIHVQHRFVK